MRAYVHTHATRPDGTRDSFASVTCSYNPHKPAVLFNGRWRRVRQEPIGAWLYIESEGERFRVLPIQGV